MLAITLLLCAGPIIELRRRTREACSYLGATTALIAVLLLARVILWFAVAPLVGSRTLTSPIDLLLTALTTAALAWIAVDVVERRRVAPPTAEAADAVGRGRGRVRRIFPCRRPARRLVAGL